MGSHYLRITCVALALAVCAAIPEVADLKAAHELKAAVSEGAPEIVNKAQLLKEVQKDDAKKPHEASFKEAERAALRAKEKQPHMLNLKSFNDTAVLDALLGMYDGDKDQMLTKEEVEELLKVLDDLEDQYNQDFEDARQDPDSFPVNPRMAQELDEKAFMKRFQRIFGKNNVDGKDIFEKLDEDKDGKLEQSELEGMIQYFPEEMSMKEFRQWYSYYLFGRSPQIYFDKMDGNSDGKLSKDEYAFENFEKQVVTKEEFKEGSGKMIEMKGEDYDVIFDHYDKKGNGDGELSHKEYQEMMHDPIFNPVGKYGKPAQGEKPARGEKPDKGLLRDSQVAYLMDQKEFMEKYSKMIGKNASKVYVILDVNQDGYLSGAELRRIKDYLKHAHDL